ncbi:MAG: glycerol-3-phosphate dehydrogenase [Cyanobacteria bacterium]|nr:glycerol-3-phosphate dehydrogenase [Cyanobacteriota bacterium]
MRPSGKQLESEFDVIVIGGGINGSGIARDAAERGMKVLLLDKYDFGAGTTAYSTRLIHGGLRYLENYEMSLVRESLREREVLLKNAPHLVKPLPLGIPIYKGDKRGFFLIRMGMILYDLLSFDKTLPKHQMLRAKQFLERFPGIKAEGLQGGAVYYDAQVNLPERICVENVVAAKSHGAVVMNHAQVEEILVEKVLNENQKASGIKFKDLLTGESLVAKSKTIVNASGIWVDDLIQKAPKSALVSDRKIGGTKGSHLVVKRFEGGPKEALYVEAKQDGRPFFIIPWQEKYYLIGTTDLPYTGDLDKVVADADEMEYLKKETKHIFPQANLEVLFTYSGVRPLPYAGNTKAGKITRKHIILDHSKKTKANPTPLEGFWSIIGGKLTTYRNLAEETVNALQKKLKSKGVVFPEKYSTTVKNPLPGGLNISNINTYKTSKGPEWAKRYNINEESVNHLIDLYGSRAQKVLDLTLENPEWKEPVIPGASLLKAQVIYGVREEMAFTTSDVLMRRTGHSLEEGCGLAFAEATAKLIGQELHWSEALVQEDLKQFNETVKTLHAPITTTSSSPPPSKEVPV